MPKALRFRLALGLILFQLLLLFAGLAPAAPPIRVGLNADLSGADRQSGEAIRRGALVAMAEINAAGGVLGRELQLVERDHRRNPARGRHNVEQLAADPAVIAILGGKHTPVILAELDSIHDRGIPYLVPWAAGSGLMTHGHQPNYVFRLSLNDAFVGELLVEHALERGLVRPGLLLEQTGWGRSNERALLAALDARELRPARVEWFNWGERDFAPALERLTAAEADSLIFVGNAPDGVHLIDALLARPASARLPVISHWGIAGGDFAAPLGARLDAVDLVFPQTFSFLDPPRPPRAERVLRRYREQFPPLVGQTLANDPNDPNDPVKTPTGFAHAYDLVHLLALAITQAGSTDRKIVRGALEQLPAYAGLVRDYDPAFSAKSHDALGPEDVNMARFIAGAIVPLRHATAGGASQ
ncbi:Leu/Ile/Val-binding protein precursor [Thiorhodovibrio winogradskyi]|uniref:Leu/Ile/Val-binding protein n=1 Tax=Thiorhodovibrio winogradskyi TaxID=77007 RepID=A0ABZ0SA42_9GAMM|nr:ABC transporter substrate-binding protein [Thiorhodovibrio winogradskyi]